MSEESSGFSKGAPTTGLQRIARAAVDVDGVVGRLEREQFLGVRNGWFEDGSHDGVGVAARVCGAEKQLVACGRAVDCGGERSRVEDGAWCSGLPCISR